jgi:hypothetical protein
MPGSNLTAHNDLAGPLTAKNRAPGRLFSAGRWALPLAAATLCAAGCAAPGEPTPPKPILPVAVADLTAHQQGDAVILTFTLPTNSTEHEPLAEPPAVEIYRGMLAASEPSHKTPTRLIYTIPSALVDTYLAAGQFEFNDPFPAADLAQNSGAQMIYMVRTRVSKKRASDDSNVVAARVYLGPETPAGLRGTITEHAIELAWQPTAAPGASAGYRVYRGELAAGATPPASAADISKLKFSAPLELLGPAPEDSYDDAQFEFDRTYVYTVRSVAQYGADSVESADSAPLIVTPRDIFPPAAPQGLEALYVSATNQQPADVELSWAISPEADLAGYNVYRSEQSGTPGQRVNQELLISPTFRDTSVVAGRRYLYQITAVDRAGNESPLSVAVSAEVPANTQ